MKVLQTKRERVCGCSSCFLVSAKPSFYPVSQRMLDRPVTLPSAGVGRQLCWLPKPQTLAADNHRIFVPHHILTSAERSTASAGCESSAWFSSCAPSTQAQCRAQVCENPMIYASTIGKAVARGATFWRGPDFLVVTARLRRGIGWRTSDCKHQSRGSHVGRGIATCPTKRSRVTRGNQPTGNTAACLSGLWRCGVGSELLF